VEIGVDASCNIYGCEFHAQQKGPATHYIKRLEGFKDILDSVR
jgi:hypothetical protein